MNNGFRSLVTLDLNEVSFQTLKDRGFQGVVFDKDNTLTRPHQAELSPHLQVRATAACCAPC